MAAIRNTWVTMSIFWHVYIRGICAYVCKIEVLCDQMCHANDDNHT